MADAPEPKEYTLSKKLRSNYTLSRSSSSTNEQYEVDIDDHQSSSEPYLYLRRNSAIVASSRRAEDESHTFIIESSNTKLSNTESDTDLNGSMIAHLQRWGLQRGEMEVDLKDRQIRQLAWKNRGVNGERFELIDTTTKLDTVIAVFEVGGLLSRSGKMKILVNWGLDFERVVLVSLLTLFEKQSFWGKTYDPRGGKKAMPIARHGGETNLAACV